VRTAISFSGGLDSTYLLWKLLTETEDEVIAFYMNTKEDYKNKFNRYRFYAFEHSVEIVVNEKKKEMMLSVIEWMQKNVRPFEYREYDIEEKYLRKDLENCPNSVNAFVALELLKNNEIDKFVSTIEMDNDGGSHVEMNNDGSSLIYLSSGFEISYYIFKNNSLLDKLEHSLLKTNYHQATAIRNIPEQALPLTRSCNLIDSAGEPCNECFKCRKRIYFKNKIDSGYSDQEIYEEYKKRCTVIESKWISMKHWLLAEDDVYAKYKGYESKIENFIEFAKKNNMIGEVPEWSRLYPL